MREKKDLWKNKRMDGQFLREMPEATAEKETWYWLRKADLKVETEAMLCAAQEQAIGTNCVKQKIDKTAQSPLCRMCDKKRETSRTKRMKKAGTKGVQEKAQCRKNSSLEIVWEIQPDKR